MTLVLHSISPIIGLYFPPLHHILVPSGQCGKKSPKCVLHEKFYIRSIQSQDSWGGMGGKEGVCVCDSLKRGRMMGQVNKFSGSDEK